VTLFFFFFFSKKETSGEGSGVTKGYIARKLGRKTEFMATTREWPPGTAICQTEYVAIMPSHDGTAMADLELVSSRH
jgi:alcohol dehydrogenase class IV